MTESERAAALVPYIRQSVEKESGISLAEQRKKVRDWADANGVDLLPEVLDEGVSSGKPWRQRGLGPILAEVVAGKAGGVVVAYSTRLSREGLSAQHEIAEHFVSAGGRVVAIDRGIDTATAGWEYLFSLDAIEKKNNLKEIGDRWDIAQQMAVGRGVHISPRVPVGYDRPFVQGTKDGKPAFDRKTGLPLMAAGPLVPNEHASAVRELFRMRARGASWGECRAMMAAAGVPSAGGDRWSSRAMGNVIENPVYLGEARYGRHRNPSAHDPLVSRKEWNAAQRTSTGVQCTRVAPLSLLRGIVFCAHCAGKLSPVKGGTNGSPRYVCRQNRQGSTECSSPASCTQAHLDDAVSEAFLMLVPNHYQAGAGTDHEPLERAVLKAQNDLDALIDAVTGADADTVATLVSAVSEKRATVRRAEEALEAASAGIGLAREAGTIGQRWEGMDNAERNRWLRVWGFRVDVSRGRGPVVDRANLSWEKEPLQPESVKMASLRDLYEDWARAEAR